MTEREKERKKEKDEDNEKEKENLGKETVEKWNKTWMK